MSFLRRLFTNAQPLRAAEQASVPWVLGQPTSLPRTRDHRFLDYEGRLYQVVSSPSGQYTLGLDDSSPDGLTSGFRGGGKGAWILFDGERVTAQGRLERPNDGAVADNGRFIVSDWLFGNQLSSRFYAFAPDGRPIIELELGANTGVSAISDDGRFMALTTLSSPGHSEWSDLLIAFDLDGGRELWRAQAVDRPESIAIDPERDAIVLAPRAGISRSLRLSTGERLAGWDGPMDKFQALQWLEAEQKADAQTTEAADSWIERAQSLARELKGYPGWQARCLRAEGEALERLGRVDEAKAAYQRGLELDPKLGVRKRLTALGVPPPAPTPRPPSGSPAIDSRAYASTSCPSCGVELTPLPKAKSRCKHCGNWIWVRGAPDGLRHLLREDELEANEQAWADAYEAKARAQEDAAEAQRQTDSEAGLLVGQYQPEVVGESHYQPAIKRLIPAGADTSAGVSVILELVPEPTNPYDSNAVSVRIEGEPVGHIHRDEAPIVGAMLRKLGNGQPMRCRGAIRGSGDYPFGVAIDGIPDAYDYV